MKRNKTKSVSQSLLIGILIVMVTAASNSIVRADCLGPVTWSGTTGDWFDGHNWSTGNTPNFDNCVYVNNGGAAVINHQLNNGGATAYSVTLGTNQGNSGQVSVDGEFNFLAVFPRCQNGAPDAGSGDMYIGRAGTGTLVITNGATVYNGHAYIAPVVNNTKPASNGVAKIAGQESAWVIFGDECRGDAGLFIGCNATSDNGGTALVDVGDGGTVEVDNLVKVSANAQQAVKVGLSGTLAGNGTVAMFGPVRLARTMIVLGTLAPSGSLTVQGNLTLNHSATTICNVTPQAWDNIEVSAVIQNGTGADGGHASLDGRLTVIMTGDFRSGPNRFPLLHADSDIDPNTKFGSESIKFPTDQGFKPKITIDYVSNNVYLDLVFDH